MAYDAMIHLKEYNSNYATMNTLFNITCRNGNVDEVIRLLKNPVIDPTDNNSNVLMSAVGQEQTEIVELLLIDGRANPGDKNNKAIIWACYMGYTEIVKLLIKDGRANPGDENNSAIRYAATCGKNDVVKLLLQDSRVDVDSEHKEAIIKAGANGHTRTVAIIVLFYEIGFEYFLELTSEEIDDIIKMM